MYITEQISVFRTNISSIVKKILNGDSVLIQRRGKIIGVLHPYSEGTKSKVIFNLMKGTGRIVGDLTEPIIPLNDWEMLK